MIEIIPSTKRHFNDFGWLQTYWLFSFGDYYDPNNVQHGALRVFNDDVVQDQSGFGRHPHQEMEIVSIVLDGEMTHKDSMGNETVIRAGDVQRMTAGTGLTHSEMNLSDKPVHFFQIWIHPDKPGLEPSYDQQNIPAEVWQKRLALLASNRKDEGAVALNTEASIYRAELKGDTDIHYQADKNRKLFVYVVRGTLALNGSEMATGDQARISGEESIEITGTADLLLIDVPATAAG